MGMRSFSSNSTRPYFRNLQTMDGPAIPSGQDDYFLDDPYDLIRNEIEGVLHGTATVFPPVPDPFTSAGGGNEVTTLRPKGML